MIETARTTWRILEPYHGMIYFAPEAAAAYERLGLDRKAGYFASRSAAFGVVPAAVVVSTFYNFNPVMVHDSIKTAWQITDPATVLEARHAAADQTLRRVLGDDVVGSAEVARAAELLRVAAEAAVDDVMGRPLFAAHAALPWPTEPHLVLWHAQTLLREYRGDVHIAALLTAGLSGIEALVTHAATGTLAAETLRKTRGWSESEWQAAIDGLRARDWLTDDDTLTFTATGEQRRTEIERLTDENSTAPYAHLGEDGCAEVQGLGRPFSRAIAEQVMPWLLPKR